MDGLGVGDVADVVVASTAAVVGGQSDDSVDHVGPVLFQPAHRLTFAAQGQRYLKVFRFEARLARLLQFKFSSNCYSI